jgi:hypothetical protein
MQHGFEAYKNEEPPEPTRGSGFLNMAKSLESLIAAISLPCSLASQSIPGQHTPSQPVKMMPLQHPVRAIPGPLSSYLPGPLSISFELDFLSFPPFFLSLAPAMLLTVSGDNQGNLQRQSGA